MPNNNIASEGIVSEEIHRHVQRYLDAMRDRIPADVRVEVRPEDNPPERLAQGFLNVSFVPPRALNHIWVSSAPQFAEDFIEAPERAVDFPPNMNPNIVAMWGKFEEYYDEHETWGSISIALDEGSLRDDDIDICIDVAQEASDAKGLRLARVLRSASVADRRRLFDWFWQAS